MIELFSTATGLLQDWLGEVDQISPPGDATEECSPQFGGVSFRQNQFCLLLLFSKANILRHVPHPAKLSAHTQPDYARKTHL